MAMAAASNLYNTGGRILEMFTKNSTFQWFLQKVIPAVAFGHPKDEHILMLAVACAQLDTEDESNKEGAIPEIVRLQFVDKTITDFVQTKSKMTGLDVKSTDINIYAQRIEGPWFSATSKKGPFFVASEAHNRTIATNHPEKKIDTDTAIALDLHALLQSHTATLHLVPGILAHLAPDVLQELPYHLKNVGSTPSHNLLVSLLRELRKMTRTEVSTGKFNLLDIVSSLQKLTFEAIMNTSVLDNLEQAFRDAAVEHGKQEIALSRALAVDKILACTSHDKVPNSVSKEAFKLLDELSSFSNKHAVDLNTISSRLRRAHNADSVKQGEGAFGAAYPALAMLAGNPDSGLQGYDNSTQQASAFYQSGPTFNYPNVGQVTDMRVGMALKQALGRQNFVPSQSPRGTSAAATPTYTPGYGRQSNGKTFPQQDRDGFSKVARKGGVSELVKSKPELVNTKGIFLQMRGTEAQTKGLGVFVDVFGATRCGNCCNRTSDVNHHSYSNCKTPHSVHAFTPPRPTAQQHPSYAAAAAGASMQLKPALRAHIAEYPPVGVHFAPESSANEATIIYSCVSLSSETNRKCVSSVCDSVFLPSAASQCHLPLAKQLPTEASRFHLPVPSEASCCQLPLAKQSPSEAYRYRSPSAAPGPQLPLATQSPTEAAWQQSPMTTQLPTVAHPTDTAQTVLDSGCAPYHCVRPSAVVHVTSTGPTEAALVQGASSTIMAPLKHASIVTTDVNGNAYQLQLPGKTAISAHFSANLISYHAMLQAKYKVSLKPTYGVVQDRHGRIIRLHVHRGLWYFPPPPSQTARHVQPPSLAAQAFAITRAQRLHSSEVSAQSSSPLSALQQAVIDTPLRRNARSSVHKAVTDTTMSTLQQAVIDTPIRRSSRSSVQQALPHTTMSTQHKAETHSPRTSRLRPATSNTPSTLAIPCSNTRSSSPENISASDLPAQHLPPDKPTSVESKHLDLWDALHRLHGHAGWRRMRKLAIALDVQDPARPSLQYLRKWRDTRPCMACHIGNATKPSHRLEHPPRAQRSPPAPGEALAIDSTGSYAVDHDNSQGSVYGGFSHSWILVDEATNLTVSIPGIKATCSELLEHVQAYQATSGVKLRSIYIDLAYHCEPLLTWTRINNIKLEACARETHEQNGRAENGVKMVKSVSRANNAQAGTPTARLQPYAHACASQQYNRTPTSKGASPLSLWPEAPWQRPAARLFPWGCRVVGFVGQQDHNPNNAMRGAPGIYIGLSTTTTGYLVYHADKDVVTTYGSVQAFPDIFPIKDMQWMGEPSCADGALDPDSWRRHAPRPLHAVDDGPAAEFLAGKQIIFDLPQHVYPSFPHTWRMRCQAPVYTRTGDKVILMRCHFVAYNGGDSELPPSELGYNTQFIDIPMSLPNGNRTNVVATAVTSTTIREALALTYPSFNTLAQISQGSAVLRGHLAVPKILDTGTEGVTALSAHSNRILLPVRTVGGARCPRAPWHAPTHHILPARKHMVLAPTPISTSTFRSTTARSLPQYGLHLNSSFGAIGFEPRSIKHAQAHESWPLWEAAINKEISGLKQRQTWDDVPESTVPRDVTIMLSKLLFKDKHTSGAKCRLVARGDMQYPKPPSSETYSGTPSATEVRTLISVATQNAWPIHSCDISQAFVQAHPVAPDAQLYVRPPPGFAPPGVVWKLRKHLYGLSCAPKAWTDTLRAFLTGYGFTPVNFSSTLFQWTDGVDHIHLCFHVDDLLLSFSNSDKAQDFKTALFTRFEGTDEGLCSCYLGIDIVQHAGRTTLSQARLARELLEEFGMSECNPAATPLPPSTLLVNKDRSSPPDLSLRQTYSHLVGTLLFLSTWTRPDIAFPVSQLSKHMSAPGPKHMAAAKHVLRYLKGTADLGIVYSKDQPDPNRIIAFADADWATCPDTRRSVSAFVILLNGGAISWKTKLQGGVATSTSAAEFISASKASDELLWLRRTLCDLHVVQHTPTPLYEDNRAARMMSENPTHRERSKHIDYRIFALRERVADGVVRLVDCPTRDMVADLLTKNLPAPAFIRHRDATLGLTPHSAPPLPFSLQVPSFTASAPLGSSSTGG